MDHSDHDDLDFSDRLAALEARVPATTTPRPLPPRRRRGRIALSIAMAPVFVLVVVATTAAGAVVVANLAVEGRPGIQNPGQPLAGAHMECMSPPEADAFLADHGFAVVHWQVESGAVAPDGGKGPSTMVHQDTPPEHGYVVPGSLLDDGSVIMVADQRSDATGTSHCSGNPMP